MGCFGSEINTPNIDKLAAEGIRMTDCEIPNPMPFVLAISGVLMCAKFILPPHAPLLGSFRALCIISICE